MSQRSQAKRGGVLRGPKAPSLRHRVEFIENYLRELQDYTAQARIKEASQHRLLDAGLVEPARTTAPTAPVNRISESALRDQLDGLLDRTNRLSGHLDALNNYLYGEPHPATSQAAEKPQPPFSAIDKARLLESHLDYALNRTEMLLNRF